MPPRTRVTRTLGTRAPRRVLSIPVDREGDAIFEIQLDVDEDELKLDGGDTEAEGLRDLAVGVRVADEVRDVALAGGEGSAAQSVLLWLA